MHETDEALVERFRAGDELAFTALFRRYRDRAASYAFRMTGRAEEADEICLEAFTRVLEGAWRPDGSFRGFLFTVVHRLCVDRLRSRSRAIRAERRMEALPLVTTSVDERLALSEDQARLTEALEGIPEDHRAALLLYYGEELPSKEVAAILECSDQQVRSRLSYARRLLRQQFDLISKVAP